MQLAEVLKEYPSLESLDKAARQGVPRKFLDELAESLGVSLRELAPHLHVSERHLRRYHSDQFLSPEVSDRTLNIARVFERAVQVLDTPDRAARWLQHPNRALGAVPLELLGTTFGVERVLAVLDRIAYGVFS